MEKESIVKAIAAVKLMPEVVDKELTTQTYMKLSSSRMVALSIGLEPVMVLLRQVTSHGQAVSGYYWNGQENRTPKLLHQAI